MIEKIKVYSFIFGIHQNKIIQILQKYLATDQPKYYV